MVINGYNKNHKNCTFVFISLNKKDTTLKNYVKEIRNKIVFS